MDYKFIISVYYLLIAIIKQVNFVSSASGWGYEGQYDVIEPSDWELISKECNGIRQSPINIRQDNIDYTQKASMIQSINGIYTIPQEILVRNNGHSVEMRFNYNSIDEIPTIIASTGVYKFDHIHVHFGKISTRGSEHSFDHHYSAAAVHVVFVNEQPTSPNSSEYYMVMASLPNVCGENTQQDAAPWTNFFRTKYCKVIDYNRNNAMTMWWPFQEGNVNIVPPYLKFNLADFMISYNQFEYFTYLGSRTTPPCTENSRIVFPNICTCIHSKALNIMRTTTTKHGYMAGNYRPVHRKFIVDGFPYIDYMRFSVIN